MPESPEAARVHRVVAAEAVSNFGSMLSRLAIPWVATLALQAGAMQMAALLLADVAAAAAGALLLGAWVEARGKRAVMLLADLGRAAVFGLLVLATWLDRLSLAGLLLAALASGVLTVVFEMARSAWVAQRVAETELASCNARLSMAGSVSETLAFALGGWLYQGLGAAWALALDALSYLGSAVCLRGVPEAAPAPRGPAGPGAPGAWGRWRAETAAGLRAIADRPVLRALAGVEALLAFGGALAGTAYMIFVSRDIGLATGPLGVIFALGGLGAVAGAAVAPRLGRRLGAGRAMTLGLAAWAVGALCVPLVPGVGWVAVGLLVAQQLVGDAGRTLHDVHDRTLRQTLVPPGLLARADAGIRAAGHFATLAGALVGGVVGTVLDARAVLWLSAVCAALAAALAAWRLAGAAARPPKAEILESPP